MIRPKEIFVATIFISGSRAIPYLPEEVRERLDRIIEEAHDVVIGDSNKGVDSMVTSFFAANQYDHVSVYTTRAQPRLNSIPSSWKIVAIKPDIQKRTNTRGETVNQRDIETEKDRAMGKIADFGFVIWRPEYPNRFGKLSVSKGSLRNMTQLLREGKPVVLYTFDESDGAFELSEMRSIENLEAFIAKFSPLVQRSYQSLLKSEDAANQRTLF